MCDITLITGTGRSGTTFAISILSLLKLPTGFNRNAVYEAQRGSAHAGLENMPQVVNGSFKCDKQVDIFKSPYLASNVHRWEKASNIFLVVVPIRKSEDAAESRAYQSKHFTNIGGFYFNSHNKEEQQVFNDHMLVNLIYSLTKNQIQFIFLAFPQFVEDSEYMYTSLKPLMTKYKVSFSDFNATHHHFRNLNFIHKFT